MRRWARLPNGTLCGGCGKSLAEGSPAQMNQLPGVKRELIRGECCAGEAPPDLPALVKCGDRPDTGNFAHVGTSMPKRTRGALRQLAASRPEWLAWEESE